MKKNQIAFVFTFGLGFLFLVTIAMGFSLHQVGGEESGKTLGLDEIYDQVHDGVRLILAYNRASTSFIGTVENTTDKTIRSIRVEVHLSNGTELGPTERMNLVPGGKAGIKLEAIAHVFTWWKAHAEIGSREHSGETPEGEGQEHAGEANQERGTEEHPGEREDTGEKLSLTDTYDHVRKGVRLILAYHKASSSFIGSVENVTDKIIESVRVTVHLSNGTELGPSEPMNLAPNEKAGVKIDATAHVFEWWKAQAESGTGEHGPSI
jgi:hypothetical protein